MKAESKKFLEELLLAPSPTGFEQPIQAVVRKHMKRFADSIETDYHGNVIVALNPKASRKVMLAGHCDQIGFMVRHITSDGFVYVSALGGIDSGVLPGAAVTIHADKGPVEGIFGRKPIHAQTAEERSKMPLDIDKAWIDIGAKNKKEAEKLIGIGDPITFKLNISYLNNDLIVSPGLDDKVGLFIVMEALKLCSQSKLPVGLYSVSTVQEEVGLRGAKTAAYGIDPEVGIAIDVTHATDNPGNENTKAVPCKLGAGPCIVRGPNVSPVIEKMLVASAKSAKIPYQISPSSGLLGNDANVIQVNKAGVATASLGIPNRYMHTQAEVCSLKDLENSAKLLAAFVRKLTAKTELRPL